MVVLTGISDEHLGAAAVRAGAQDYLVKGQVDGLLLYRVVRYAIERRRLEETQRQLREAQIIARENSRLERGLLPSPMLADSRVTVAARYRPGGGQSLLGGDFYDVVETADGWVHALVGDVCGRGPDEAALGRLPAGGLADDGAGRPADGRDPVRGGAGAGGRAAAGADVHHRACVLSIAPDRTRGRLYLAGHPPPLLLTGGRGAGAERARVPAAGHRGDQGLAAPRRSSSAPTGRCSCSPTGSSRAGSATGAERLGTDGLIENIEAMLRAAPSGRRRTAGGATTSCWISWSSRVRELNGGELDDDLAVLAVGYPAAGRDDRPDRLPPPAPAPSRPSRPARARGRRPDPGPAPSGWPGPPAAGRWAGWSRSASRSWPCSRVAAIVIGALALTDLTSARSRVVQTLDPAAFQASQLYVPRCSNQETGVRGYALSAQRSFLEPVHRRAWPRSSTRCGRLRPVLAGLPVAAGRAGAR